MNKPILIIAAMEDVELDYIESKMEDLNKVKYKGFSFFEGKLLGEDVVLCEFGTDAINITCSECKGEGDSVYDYELTTFLHGEENKLIRKKADLKFVKAIKEKFEDRRIVYRKCRKRRYLE